MNKVILVGNLTRDPNVKITSTGKSVVNFNIATNEGFGDKKRGEFHNIVGWEKHAEAVGNNLSTGSTVLIEGRLQTRNYEGKDGNKRSITEVVMTAMPQFLSPRK
ncbi:MAG: single-stranded DNA-binding protein [Patescibacteria group bacterium]|jgi:single-strand DNA-binding protein